MKSAHHHPVIHQLVPLFECYSKYGLCFGVLFDEVRVLKEDRFSITPTDLFAHMNVVPRSTINTNVGTEN